MSLFVVVKNQHLCPNFDEADSFRKVLFKKIHWPSTLMAELIRIFLDKHFLKYFMPFES